jgi:hypothetical protein
MRSLKSVIVPFLGIVLVLGVSGGFAQQDTVGDTRLLAEQDDLDSYWLDSRLWNWYGYRPYTKTHISRFEPSLPTWSTGTTGYSYGMNESAGNAPWEGGPPVKFQLQNNGTWH